MSLLIRLISVAAVVACALALVAAYRFAPTFEHFLSLDPLRRGSATAALVGLSTLQVVILTERW